MELMLISVEKKKIYEATDFQETQYAHSLAMRERLSRLVEEVKEAIDQVRETFSKDSEEVQREWVKFTQKIDKRVEDSLRYCIKRSLQEFSRLLNGDNKSHEVSPLFHVTLVLNQNRVHLSPDIDTLLDLVHRISRHLIAVTQVRPSWSLSSSSLKHCRIDFDLLLMFSSQAVPRLALQLTEKQARDLADSGQPPPRPQLSIYEAISGDEEAVLKTVMQITAGVTAVVDKVTAYTQYWEKEYKSIWEVDKEAYIRRYEKAQKPLSSFEADISRYMGQKERVQIEETPTHMRFMRIDGGSLKQVLMGHCEAWVSKFTGLLLNLAAAELHSLHDFFKESSEQLSIIPSNLDQLAEVSGQWPQLALSVFVSDPHLASFPYSLRWLIFRGGWLRRKKRWRADSSP
jgi:dynein heavy chain